MKPNSCKYELELPEWLKIRAKMIGWEEIDRVNKQRQLKNVVLLALLTAIIFFGIVFVSLARAQEIPCPAVDLEIIAQIESGGNPLAVSYAGAKHGRGLYQISEIALADFNFAHPTEILPLNALFKPLVAKKVAIWYTWRLKQILARRGISAQIPLILISYNWGPGNCIKWYKAGADYNKLPKETKNYITKYNRLAQCQQ